MSAVSQDLVWELTRGSNSYLVKRRNAGTSYMSRDPMNLTNKHSRKYEGFVTDKAIGIQPRAPTTAGTVDTGVQLTQKRPGKTTTPAKSLNVTEFAPGTSSRRTARGVVNKTARNGYRPDLRAEAVARASAIKRSQKSERKVREQKPRGAKAKALKAKEDA